MATLGTGTFNSTSGIYAGFLANITLTLDTVAQTWSGTYAIPAGQAAVTDVQARVSATDSTNPPNAGGAFTTRFAIRAPDIVEVPEYRNTTVKQSTGFETPIVGGIAIVLLLAGIGIGYVMTRGRKKQDEETKTERPKTEQ